MRSDLRTRRRALVGVVAMAATLVPLAVAASPSGATAFCNTTPIIFTPPAEPTSAVLPLQPYPSPIAVEGLSGQVTDVNVTLNDLDSYPRPEDLDVLLVAPDGSTNLLVMSDVGGDNVYPGEPASHATLTFDDEAAGPAPADSLLVTGTYRPTDDDNDVEQFVDADVFVAPAPAPSPAIALSVFDGLSPDGTWKLYIVDDQPGPPVTAGFNGGWCLDITTGDTTTSSSTSSTAVPAVTCDGRVDTIVGTAGADVIAARGGNDTIQGLDGDDVICGDAGRDTIEGNDGNDRILGGTGDDDLYGKNGNDVILGGSGDDRLSGGGGDDSLKGNDGTDKCLGDTGTDTGVTCETTVDIP